MTVSSLHLHPVPSFRQLRQGLRGGGIHLPNKIHPSIIPKKQIGDVPGLDWGNRVIMLSVFTELFKYRVA